MNNCTIQKELIDGYYMLKLEMHDLDLYPGDHKPLIKDDDLRAVLSVDEEFEDETNQTYFDSIRYYFLVSLFPQMTYAILKYD